MSGESAPAPVLPLRVASVVAAHAHAKYERARVPKSDAQAAPLISQRGCVISRRRPESPVRARDPVKFEKGLEASERASERAGGNSAAVMK